MLINKIKLYFLIYFYFLFNKNNYHYLIKLAAEYGSLETLKTILNKSKISPDFDNNIAIETASENGHLDIIKFLLNYNIVNSSVNHGHLIYKAAINGHIDIVKFLLNDNKTNPSFNGNFTIRICSDLGKTEVVDILWSSKYVKNTLAKDCTELYNDLNKRDIKNKVNEF